MTWLNGRAGVKTRDAEQPVVDASVPVFGPIESQNDRDRCLAALVWVKTGRHDRVVR